MVPITRIPVYGVSTNIGPTVQNITDKNVLQILRKIMVFFSKNIETKHWTTVLSWFDKLLPHFQNDCLNWITADRLSLRLRRSNICPTDKWPYSEISLSAFSEQNFLFFLSVIKSNLFVKQTNYWNLYFMLVLLNPNY